MRRLVKSEECTRKALFLPPLKWLGDCLCKDVVSFRQKNTGRPTASCPGVAERVSIQKAIWLLARPYENLKADERRDLQDVCEVCSELAALQTLAQSFGHVVRKRDQHRLQDWIKQVEASSFHHTKRFAAGLQRDKEEVLAGLTLVSSNGQVEGFVNKLKLIKRMG